jgi:hypothetical protein
LLTGTPSSPKGAAGYFATTTTGIHISHLRSAVCKGFFNGLFLQGKRTFGEACEAGRANVYNLYNSSSEYRGFTTLGDPEMNIWTATPKPLEVFHDSQLSTDDDSLVVRVEFQSAPVESALVCIMHDTVVYEYGYTTSNGEIIFNFESLDPGFMHITVTARNKMPHLDSIPIVPTYVEETEELTALGTNDIVIHPNPFTHTTNIRYAIPDSRYSIETPGFMVYDATGRLVKYLNLESSIQNQESCVVWDGSDNMGNRLPAGIYFVQDVNSKEKLVVPVLLVR